ncbi:MAG TPA: YqeG family HAD IIIA-type phosphatase [Magnetospirillaceae bacterium]|nr:YqeG family HAD IIIA-type phosphatase [Magnetospirillaceae bacterium]
MIRLLTPDAMAERVEDITVEMLQGMGVHGVALDLDNTIVPWHTADLTPTVSAWVGRLLAGGLRVCLVTNNYAGHAADVARGLGVPIVAGALKPVPIAFRRALAALHVPAANGAVIGDQLFTDVLGGKLLGMRAILVKPIGGREFFTTRLMRMMERPLLARMRIPS